ncbi:hypothetical protein Tco_1542889, partial [Tanacetum coccineum]
MTALMKIEKLQKP